MRYTAYKPLGSTSVPKGYRWIGDRVYSPDAKFVAKTIAATARRLNKNMSYRVIPEYSSKFGGRKIIAYRSNMDKR